MAKIYFSLPIILSVLLGCDSQPQPAAQNVSLETFQSGPKLVKIPIASKAAADSMIQKGFDVVVVEDDYVIARLSADDAQSVQAMSLNMQTISESDMVQRLIKVVMKQPSDLQEIGDTGIDVWEVKGDTVVAQAYDKYIRTIEQLGYPVIISEKNIRNLTRPQKQN